MNHRTGCQVETSGLCVYGYDDSGRLVSVSGGMNNETKKYTYGYLDKILTVATAGEEKDFFYNADGMLVGKEREGCVELQAWDGVTLLARGEDTFINERGVGGGGLVMLKDNEGFKVCATDYLKNTLFIGAESHASTAYGTGQENGTFNGQWFDQDIGAFVYAFRNYMPGTMKWMSQDPMGFPDGTNNYAFVKDPVSEMDIYGLITVGGSSTGATPLLPATSTPQQYFTLNFSGGLSFEVRVEFQKNVAETSDDLAETVRVWKDPIIHQKPGTTPVLSAADKVVIAAYFKMNCHGHLFGADGWIDTGNKILMPAQPKNNVDNILKGDGYKITENLNSRAKAVTYQYVNSDPNHSALVATYTPAGKVDKVSYDDSYNTNTVAEHSEIFTNYGGAPAKYWEK